ncbi:unnamed protein product [Staurois parvus]|uniref:Secreted protein n=1 Tax=Staurois parvus TaxID=386267 RepID=A0ABN9GPF4_9NEOB|nr:unnamed protein product [Staurois parvus]
MLLPGPECLMGALRASHCCCQAPNLAMGPCTGPPPHAAAKVHSLSWVPVRPQHHCCCKKIATLCHVPLSGPPHTLLVCFNFLT